MFNRVLQEFCGMKAVFYARVSTEEEEQLNAIELQIEENRSVIKENKWVLVDEYIDRGKSGTKIKGRDEYQRLYADMLTDKFELIVVKDQDRLQRNTKDWYLFVDRLVTTGKKLYLYLDGKFFSPGEDALITGIKAIMAEEYSRNLSKKLHNFNDRRLDKARQGDHDIMLQGNGRAFGWDKKDGKYVINPEQFKIRRLMCEFTLQGDGTSAVAKKLNEMGYRNSAGNLWKGRDIPRFIYSEMNVGTLILNRVRQDFEGKRRIYTPPEEWVYLENALPPVVTPEEWAEICKIRERRSQLCGVAKRGKKAMSYFSGRLTCGCCGAVYWSKHSGGEQYWACSTKQSIGRKTRARTTALGKAGEQNEKGCDGFNISTAALMELLNAVSARLTANKDVIKADLIKYLSTLKKSILGANTGLTAGSLNKERQRKEKLLDLFLDGGISKEDYQRKTAAIEEKISVLTAELKEAETRQEDVAAIDAVIEHMDEEVDKYVDGNNEIRLKWLMDNLEEIVVYEGAVVIKIPVIGKGVIAGFTQLVADREGRCRR